MKIEYRKVGAATYHVYINGYNAGSLEPLDDGYYEWWPDIRPGYIPSYVLRSLADKVDELNKEWDEQVKRDVG